MAKKAAALEADEDDCREIREMAAFIERFVLRGDVHVLRPPQRQEHGEQRRQFGVIVQPSELLPRSVVLVAPTSRSARPAASTD
jgi:hypothetical protein